MGGFFTRERFGRPQILAGLLLLIFLAECAWLAGLGISRNEWDPGDEIRLVEGVRQWSGGPVAGTSIPARDVPVGLEQDDGYDPNHSPLWYLVASAPLAIWPGQQVSAQLVGWLARAPYLLFGVLLGGSLWYVSRRLYGDAGGYIALALYCFSPGIIRSSAVWAASPEIGAAWGAFGAVFTAIAAAHTLYAPREVVLWNWRRILLLGLSLALAIGSQFSLIVVVPIALAFMLYLAPARRVAAAVIWASACGIGLLLLYASYFFHPSVFWQGIRHANFLGINWRAFAEPRTYQQILIQLGESSPALIVAVPLAARHLPGLVSSAVLRQHGSASGDSAAFDLGTRHDELSGARVSTHGGAVSVRICGGSFGGSPGDWQPEPGVGLRLGVMRRERLVVCLGAGANGTRITSVTACRLLVKADFIPESSQRLRHSWRTETFGIRERIYSNKTHLTWGYTILNS